MVLGYSAFNDSTEKDFFYMPNSLFGYKCKYAPHPFLLESINVNICPSGQLVELVSHSIPKP